jgi:hypothetical protein
MPVNVLKLCMLEIDEIYVGSLVSPCIEGLCLT